MPCKKLTRQALSAQRVTSCFVRSNPERSKGFEHSGLAWFILVVWGVFWSFGLVGVVWKGFVVMLGGLTSSSLVLSLKVYGIGLFQHQEFSRGYPGQNRDVYIIILIRGRGVCMGKVFSIKLHCQWCVNCLQDWWIPIYGLTYMHAIWEFSIRS